MEEIDLNINSQFNSNIINTKNHFHHNLLFENFLGNFSNNNRNVNLLNERILPFNNNHSLCQDFEPSSFLQNLKNYERNSKYEEPDKIKRILPKLPERVLDAPELSDDFYLNLLDWSSKNVLAIVLGLSIYLWNSETGQNNILTESVENVCSINWMNSGTCLAVGLENGAVQLWDTNKNELLRTMTGHSDRTTALSWNEYILSSGSRDSKIFNHDVRMQSHITSTYLGHRYEVCGLKWSPDGAQLASGGGDNKICIWDVNRNSNINALLYEMEHDFSNFNNNELIDEVVVEDYDSSNSRINQNEQINTLINPIYNNPEINIETHIQLRRSSFTSFNSNNSLNFLPSRINENGISNNNNNANVSQSYLTRHIASLRSLGKFN